MVPGTQKADAQERVDGEQYALMLNLRAIEKVDRRCVDALQLSDGRAKCFLVAMTYPRYTTPKRPKLPVHEHKLNGRMWIPAQPH